MLRKAGYVSLLVLWLVLIPIWIVPTMGAWVLILSDRGKKEVGRLQKRSRLDRAFEVITIVAVCTIGGAITVIGIVAGWLINFLGLIVVGGCNSLGAWFMTKKRQESIHEFFEILSWLRQDEEDLIRIG